MKKLIYGMLLRLSKPLSILPKRIKYTLYELNSGTNFKIQLALRYIIVASIVRKIGQNVYIGKHVSLKNIEQAIIGNNVSIHDMCYVDGFGGLEIGNDVSIAHSSSLISANHTWNDKNTPIKYNKVSAGKIVIKDDVWIGCGVRVLSNVEINHRSVIAAGAVVNKNTEPNSLNAGVPIKKIKEI
ncbi:acyltransferase [Staphylococcus sp. HKU1]|uniref:acyltransferase n=1 Tax=unclassified Staphylococcus TaxID=91994 RepID=UPI00203FFC45|nr:acyltransferase [Staphylococcus sp. Marseille-Q6910]